MQDRRCRDTAWGRRKRVQFDLISDLISIYLTHSLTHVLAEEIGQETCLQVVKYSTYDLGDKKY